jgi:UDPglucose 6-dehydrogenase
MQISVIGTGYVGVVTAVVLAELGHDVFAIDIDKTKIALLKQGKSPIYEPGLEELLQKNIKAGRLHFTSSYKDSIPVSQAVFICVGTPSKKDGSYDPKYVLSATKDIAKNLGQYTVIAIKSTVPPSIGEEVRLIVDKYTDKSYDLASVPEFLREGSAIEDAFNPSRIVIGVDSDRAEQVLLDIHKKLPGKKIVCSIKSAQLVKYAANAFLATKISFINSLAILADKIGADIDEVVDGFGSDPRIGKSFLRAGLGYGGSCFPKDTHALIAYADKLSYDFSFLKQVDKINKQQVSYVVSKIKKMVNNKPKNRTVALLGLAFKPHTDDMREARSITLVKKLISAGFTVKVYDPIAMSSAKKLLPENVYMAKNSLDCVRGADILCLVTEWPEFFDLDWKKVKKIMKSPIVFDGRNFLDYNKLKDLGFQYEGIGRR